MAKIFTFIVVATALMAVCQAATKQDGLLNCGAAQKLGKDANTNNCCQLCWCLGNQSGNKAFAAASIQNMCKQQCTKCVAAVNDKKQCPKSDSPLPETCTRGLQSNAMIKSVMDKCAAMYSRDPSSLRKVPGC